MANAERRFKRLNRKLSEIGKNKPKFRLNEDENDSQAAAKGKRRSYRFEADHELINWWVTDRKKK